MVQGEPSGEFAAGRDGKKRGVFGRIVLFFRQVFAELRKVVTPTRQELIKFTLVVLGFVVVMMAIVYALDLLFTLGAEWVFGTPAGAF